MHNPFLTAWFWFVVDSPGVTDLVPTNTVNTASRMETTGQAGRIQCSEATDAELEAHGKREWLMVRKDRVVARGKGELQT